MADIQDKKLDPNPKIEEDDVERRFDPRRTINTEDVYKPEYISGFIVIGLVLVVVFTYLNVEYLLYDYAVKKLNRTQINFLLVFLPILYIFIVFCAVMLNNWYVLLIIPFITFILYVYIDRGDTSSGTVLLCVLVATIVIYGVRELYKNRVKRL